MESLAGIALGPNDRYVLQSLVERSGYRFVYDAHDREADCPRRVEIWNLELTTDQDEFLSRLKSISQVEDRRLVPVVDGGILVIPSGIDILKEVPYVVTEAITGEAVRDDLSLDQALTIGIKVAAILHRLHSGTHIRARSGQIIGQLKLSHGNLSLDTIRTDPRDKVILTDWYRYSLLESAFDPGQDLKDLTKLLQELLPRTIWPDNYSSAKALGEELRAQQLKLKQSWYSPKLWVIFTLLLLPIGGLIVFRPQPIPVTAPPRPITVSPPLPPRTKTKFVTKPEPPREQQVYRIDLPTAPKPQPAPKPAELPPIPRSTRPQPVPPPPPVAINPVPPVGVRTPPAPLVPPSNDPEPFKTIETTIDGNFASSYTSLVQQAGSRALVTIAGEFINPNRQEVRMLVLATKQGRTAPIFSARVNRSEWENDPTGTTWANFMTRSSTLLGFNAPPNPNSFRISLPAPVSPLVPSIQPLKSNPVVAPKTAPATAPKKDPTPEEIEQQINDRK